MSLNKKVCFVCPVKILQQVIVFTGLQSAKAFYGR